MLFDTYSAEEIEGFLMRLDEHAGAAAVADDLEVGAEDAAELLGIFAARKKNSKSSVPYLQPDDLRFGTQHDVATWRATRLACSTIIEIGAGVGMQTMEFARTCKSVIAVEIDPRKSAYCKANCKAEGLTNITFINGDAMGVVKTLPPADIVFLDPQRPAEEEVRDLHVNFSPPIHEFIEAYGKITPSIAIEIPPHIKRIDVECEQEYISLNGELRRLTLYLGPLAKAERSAVALPAGARIEGPASATPEQGALERYLYEADEAVLRAQLIPAVLSEHMHLFSTYKHILLTGKHKVANPFFRNSFSVLASCPPDDASIKEALASVGAKTVVLRSSVDPTKYWSERAKFEKGLSGTETVHLFKLPDIAIIVKKMATNVI